nr:alcohol dehydrogenase [Paraburkholderia sediminicola]
MLWVTIPAESFARVMVFAMRRSADVGLNEILFRPTRQAL